MSRIAIGRGTVDFTNRRSSGPIGAYIGTDVQTANAAAYTFSSKDLGTATADRVIAVTILLSSYTVGTARLINALTVNGVAGTVHAQVRQDNNGSSAIASALVPSGATGDIVVTLSGTALACRIGWCRLRPVTALPVTFGATTGSQTTLPLAVQNHGWVFGNSLRGAATTPLSWNGTSTLVENFSGTVENVNGGQIFSIDTIENFSGTISTPLTSFKSAAFWL